MSRGLLLHLSGPRQHWGGPQGGNRRDTHPHPTRSGLTGLLAAAQGRPRGSDMSDLTQVHYTVRIDRSGQREMDFHTIGGGNPKARTVLTADGNRRGSAVTYEDWYLTDAAFTVAVTGPTNVLRAAGAALHRPYFPPHLGRRSCQPDVPVLIDDDTADPEDALHQLPLHRSPPHKKQTIEVTFLTEAPPLDQPNLPHTRTIDDSPLPGRTWTQRKVWQTRHRLPASLCAGSGTQFLHALTRLRTAV